MASDDTVPMTPVAAVARHLEWLEFALAAARDEETRRRERLGKASDKNRERRTVRLAEVTAEVRELAALVTGLKALRSPAATRSATPSRRRAATTKAPAKPRPRRRATPKATAAAIANAATTTAPTPPAARPKATRTSKPKARAAAKPAAAKPAAKSTPAKPATRRKSTKPSAPST